MKTLEGWRGRRQQGKKPGKHTGPAAVCPHPMGSSVVWMALRAVPSWLRGSALLYSCLVCHWLGTPPEGRYYKWGDSQWLRTILRRCIPVTTQQSWQPEISPTAIQVGLAGPPPATTIHGHNYPVKSHSSIFLIHHFQWGEICTPGHEYKKTKNKKQQNKTTRFPCSSKLLTISGDKPAN